MVRRGIKLHTFTTFIIFNIQNFKIRVWFLYKGQCAHLLFFFVSEGYLLFMAVILLLYIVNRSYFRICDHKIFHWVALVFLPSQKYALHFIACGHTEFHRSWLFISKYFEEEHTDRQWLANMSVSQFHLLLSEIWGSHSSKFPGSNAVCLVGGYQHFRGACCHDLHGRKCWEEDWR